MYLRPDTNQSRPSFLTITALGDDCPWEFVPTQALPACCLPADTPAAGCLIKVTGPHEGPLRSGLRRAVPLAVWQLKAVINHLKLKMPVKGEGTNKDKSVGRMDLIRVVVGHVFADLTADEREQLALKLFGNKAKANPATTQSAPDDETPATHLKLLAKLDVKEAPEFDVMKKQALDALAEQQLKASQKKKSREQRERERQQQQQMMQQPPVAEAGGLPAAGPARPAFEDPLPRASGLHVKAPAEMKQFLPPGVDYVYFRWEPHKNRVCIEFQRT